MPSMAGPAAAADRPWPPKRIAIYAAAIVAAALVGILVASMFTNTGNANAYAPAAATETTQAAAANQMAPVDDSTTQSTTTTTTTTTSSQPTYTQLRAVVTTYLGLLPAQPAQAWQLLTPAEQQRNGGFGPYQMLWAQEQSAKADMIVPHGTDGVVAHVTLVSKAGQSSAATVLFSFQQSGSGWLIDNITQQGKTKTHDG
jgi:hypothetical protein